jgi:hypothetical protein
MPLPFASVSRSHWILDVLGNQNGVITPIRCRRLPCDEKESAARGRTIARRDCARKRFGTEPFCTTSTIVSQCIPLAAISWPTRPLCCSFLTFHVAWRMHCPGAVTSGTQVRCLRFHAARQPRSTCGTVERGESDGLERWRDWMSAHDGRQKATSTVLALKRRRFSRQPRRGCGIEASIDSCTQAAPS